MKFTLALFLLVCIAFQAEQIVADTVGQNIDQMIDYTQEKASDAYDSMKDMANWVGDKISDATPESVKELGSDLKDVASDAADSLGDAANEAGKEIDEAL